MHFTKFLSPDMVSVLGASCQPKTALRYVWILGRLTPIVVRYDGALCLINGSGLCAKDAEFDLVWSLIESYLEMLCYQ